MSFAEDAAICDDKLCATLGALDAAKKRLVARFGADAVQTLDGSVGYTAEWSLTHDGTRAELGMRMTERRNLRIEFSKNLAHGIIESGFRNFDSTTFIRLKSGALVKLFDHEDFPFMHGIWHFASREPRADGDPRLPHTLEHLMDLLDTLFAA